MSTQLGSHCPGYIVMTTLHCASVSGSVMANFVCLSSVYLSKSPFGSSSSCAIVYPPHVRCCYLEACLTGRQPMYMDKACFHLAVIWVDSLSP